MAYQNSTNPNLSEDDEEPLVFKRSSTASKQNQLDTKKFSTQRCDGQPRRVSDIHSSNGVNSCVQKGNMAPSTKASPVKSPTATPKELSQQNKSASIKEEKTSVEHPAGDNSDSDDEKPILARLKAKSNNVKKEDSDDEDDKPLSARVNKFNVGTSGCKPSDSKERKPLASTIQKNGSSTIDKGKSSSLVSNKRPLDKANCSEQSLVKKPKIADISTSVKSKQVSAKTEPKADDDDMTLSQRMKKATSVNKTSLTKKTVSKVSSSSIQKKIKKKPDIFSKYSKSTREGPSSNDGQKKWTTLDHNGVIFPPPYKPHGVKMLYNGKPVNLTPEQEEVATMYAVMIDTDYVQKETFRDNFWNDWQRKGEEETMTTEEKKAAKEEKLKQEEKYMWAVVDGVKEKVGNFRVEPPGLFRGRGEHPKSGKLKRRIRPSDVTINIGKDAEIPECPIPGERWKEIRHDNTVTWLAFWNDPINPKEFKYVFLAASSSLKGQSDKEKYEKARKLKDYIGDIRAAYTRDFTSRDPAKRQIAVATYLIDKLALRAGNEKDDDEADTVGCCTLKVENVKAIAPSSLEFNFLVSRREKGQ
ncbi:hypothetical protein M0R45_020802 [Rubus argutus]|uniref:DNA topoisomerase n=1 Tax=Rubus argutus TaxID=59490 RepID=A0AAW1XBQ0_RUBAR